MNGNEQTWRGDSVPDWREIARRDVERFRATIDELRAAAAPIEWAMGWPVQHDSDSGCEVEP